jgi:hypothetical protein
MILIMHSQNFFLAVKNWLGMAPLQLCSFAKLKVKRHADNSITSNDEASNRRVSILDLLRISATTFVILNRYDNYLLKVAGNNASF